MNIFKRFFTWIGLIKRKQGSILSDDIITIEDGMLCIVPETVDINWNEGERFTIQRLEAGEYTLTVEDGVNRSTMELTVNK